MIGDRYCKLYYEGGYLLNVVTSWWIHMFQVPLTSCALLLCPVSCQMMLIRLGFSSATVGSPQPITLFREMGECCLRFLALGCVPLWRPVLALYTEIPLPVPFAPIVCCVALNKCLPLVLDLLFWGIVRSLLYNHCRINIIFCLLLPKERMRCKRRQGGKLKINDRKLFTFVSSR